MFDPVQAKPLEQSALLAQEDVSPGTELGGSQYMVPVKLGA